jgi:hypothetical protein
VDLRLSSFGKCLSGQDLQTNVGWIERIERSPVQHEYALYWNILDARVAA